MKQRPLTRGDVVIVDFRPTSPAAQTRPALIVQNNRDNARTTKTIIAQITSNLRRAHEDTHLLIDPRHADWARSGLRAGSAVNCSNLVYVQQSDVKAIIGHLAPTTMATINECLKAALDIQ